MSVSITQSRSPCTWRRVETKPQHNSEDLRRSQKLSKPPVSSACVAIWEARRLFGSLLLEVYFQSSVFTLPCLIQGRYDCYGWTNEQCDTVGKMMIFCPWHFEMNPWMMWQEIDLGLLAACIGELLHKFVLSLVEPSCSGVPEIMLIKRVRGGKLPRAHGTGRLILTVPNNPLLTGMSNHSWQLRNQFCFAIYVHLLSFFY